MNPFLLVDGYKTSHHNMYPENTTLVFDNLTPRSEKHAPIKEGGVIVFGINYALITIHNLFEEHFFKKKEDDVISEIETTYSRYLGTDYDASHIRELHRFGRLPITVKALPEGTFCPIGVPCLTIHNDNKRFYWLPNFLETIISTLIWKPMTTATIAFSLKKLGIKWAKKTSNNNLGAVDYQFHDFSMRGMSSIGTVVGSSMAHCLFHKGSDCIPAIHGIKTFYNETLPDIYSVPATEHSVMCAGEKGSELETFRRLMKTYPKGILSIVSDTWDLWKVCTNYLPTLKDEIMAREGKIVIRPDSGDPVDILCGTIRFDSKEKYNEELKDGSLDKANSEEKGVVELLWETFGGTTNAQGYKELNSHIGVIYGDSITYERAQKIFERLEAKGFASTNVVLGVGSFTYQYNTRDTYGFAVKATYIEKEVDGKTEKINIFKDPITDDGTKKSAKGLLTVVKSGNTLTLQQEQSWGEVRSYTNELKVCYTNGSIYTPVRFDQIQYKANSNIK